jgi:tRNA(fMet)-specific endonuclease VapC
MAVINPEMFRRESTNYCIDSDVLIDFLRGKRDADDFFTRAIEEDRALAISIISVVELWSGNETSPDKPDWVEKVARLERLLSLFVWLDLHKRTAQLAGELRRDYRTPFADAIVAASALNAGFALVTKNLKHYEPLQARGLKVVRPY